MGLSDMFFNANSPERQRIADSVQRTRQIKQLEDENKKLKEEKKYTEEEVINLLAKFGEDCSIGTFVDEFHWKKIASQWLNELYLKP